MDNKFKVGDIVKIIAERPTYGFGSCKFGDIGKIKTLPDESSTITVVDFPNDHNWFATSADIELVQEEVLPSKYKFKVGDRVRTEEYGIGTVKFVDEEDDNLTYAVECDEENECLGSCGGKTRRGCGLWCREDEIELIIEDIKEQDVTDIDVGDNTPQPNLDTLVKKIIEITENSPVTFDFYSNSIAVELYESAIIIQYIAKTNTVFLDLELSDGKIDTETLMQAAKVMEVLEQNKELLKEFCTK